MHNNNVNVIGKVAKETMTMSMNNDKYEQSKIVESIAEKLSTRLGAHKDSWGFLCKVAWKLPEHVIWSNCEAATTGKSVKNPMGLFIYLCKRSGV